MNPLWTALIVAVPAFLGPWIAIRANGRERRKDQTLTWERDDKVAKRVEEAADKADEVAAQAAEAADLLLAAQRATTVRTDQVAADLAATTTQVNGKLDKIHVLVNSTLTAAMDSELAALLQQVLLMERAGDPDDLIAGVRLRTADLQAKLADRARQTVIADAADPGLP